MGLFQRKYTDSKLMEMLLQAGRRAERALDHLYGVIGGPIRGQLVKDGATPDEAQDAFQEAMIDFLAAYRREGFAIRVSIRAWLSTVARNHWLNARKKQERSHRFADEILLRYHPYTDDSDARRLQGLLEGILSRLDAQCRRLLEWTYMDGLDRQAVADLMQYGNLNSVSNKRTVCLEQALAIGHEQGYFKS